MGNAGLYAISILGEEVTPARISQWQILEPHTISGMVSRMEKEGLVKKVKDLRKKNWVRVVITEKGSKAFAQSTTRESIHHTVGSLSPEQRLQFHSCLEVLQESAPVRDLWSDHLRARRKSP